MQIHIYPLNIKRLANHNSQRGISLLAMSLFLLGVGLFTLPALQLYKTKQAYEQQDTTDKKINEIQLALQRFQSLNGFYPCPAPIDAAIDTPAFGVSVTDNCSAAPVAAGTFRAPGRDGVTVRTGAVPVRTLGLEDSYIYDGFDSRYVYAVTEIHAVRGVRPPAFSGAIQVNDINGNNATAVQGNIVELVYSMGADTNGAYTRNGALIQACDAAARSAENCNYNVNAIFLNSIQKSNSENANNKYTTIMSYAPNKDPVPCEATMGGNTLPNNMTFLVDTSGSMAGEGTDGVEGSPLIDCPAGMEGKCTRMDLAHWAMRRVMPVRLSGDRKTQPIGQTNLTGFRCFGNRGSLGDCASMTAATFARSSNSGDKTNFSGNMLFDDPTKTGYQQPDAEAIATKLEPILEQTCPQTNTPLGKHMQVLADQLGNGTEKNPNKITVISDGEDNVLPECGNKKDCPTLVGIATEIKAKYKYLQIDIVDVSNNASLRGVAEATGGKYYSTSNPDHLLNSLFNSMGVCRPAEVPRPWDKKNCERPPEPKK